MVKNVLNTLRKKQKNNKGFSLVELIVVIAIMAVLVGVLAPQFIKYVERSRQSTDLQNVEELKNADKLSGNIKIENVTFANDLERHWIQNNPTILYDIFSVKKYKIDVENVHLTSILLFLL